MSIIRATSNPEGLYAFSNADGFVEFIFPEDSEINNCESIKIPKEIWNKFVEWFRDPMNKSFFYLQNYYKDGELVVEHGKIKGGKFYSQNELVISGRYGMKIQYQDKYIILWPVTFWAIT